MDFRKNEPEVIQNDIPKGYPFKLHSNLILDLSVVLATTENHPFTSVLIRPRVEFSSSDKIKVFTFATKSEYFLSPLIEGLERINQIYGTILMAILEFNSLLELADNVPMLLRSETFIEEPTLEDVKDIIDQAILLNNPDS